MSLSSSYSTVDAYNDMEENSNPGEIDSREVSSESSSSDEELNERVRRHKKQIKKRRRFLQSFHSSNNRMPLPESSSTISNFEVPSTNRDTKSADDLDYLEKLSKVVEENAKGEFLAKKKLYQKLLKDKENAENLLKANNQDLALESSRLQKHELDIQIWKDSIYNTSQKIGFLDKDINEVEDKLQKLKSRRLELSLDKRSFEGIVLEKSARLRALQQQIKHSKDGIKAAQQNVESIQIQIDDVFKKKSAPVDDSDQSDPFISHLDKQIAQKKEELECPVCFSVCKPPILRCPEFHLVCSECWPRMSVCGECRAPYEGRMRHRYAERTHKEMEDLVQTREVYLEKK